MRPANNGVVAPAATVENSSHGLWTKYNWQCWYFLSNSLSLTHTHSHAHTDINFTHLQGTYGFTSDISTKMLKFWTHNYMHRDTMHSGVWSIYPHWVGNDVSCMCLTVIISAASCVLLDREGQINLYPLWKDHTALNSESFLAHISGRKHPLLMKRPFRSDDWFTCLPFQCVNRPVEILENTLYNLWQTV